MTGNLDVRAARYGLATALMRDSGRNEEATAELRRALDELGSDPPDWQLHLHLAELAASPAIAAQEMITAVLLAPADSQQEPAAAALSRLTRSDAVSLANALDQDTVAALTELTSMNGANPVAAQLAAQILGLRGDVRAAASLISTSSELSADPKLAAALAVQSAVDLLDQGDFHGALDRLSTLDVADDQGAAALRAFALYGLGQYDEALQTLENAPRTFDAAAVRVLVRLSQAASTPVEDREPEYAEAERAAGDAARLDPSGGEGLLLRAQIALERGSDTTNGRRLLAAALDRLHNAPEEAISWRVQLHARHDGLFRYMRLEVAAICGRTSDLAAVQLGDLPMADTSWAQDAAAAELIAETHRVAGQVDTAIQFMEAAAGYYGTAVQPDRAVTVRQALFDIEPRADRLVALADAYWTASFSEARSADAKEQAVTGGLTALDELDGRFAEIDKADRLEAAYLRGLLLVRVAQFATTKAKQATLKALPWLLAAALDDPGHSYRAMYLSQALDLAGMHRPALHFAERALELRGFDTWVQEASIIVKFNWYGSFDDATSKLAEEHQDKAWYGSVRLYEALLCGDVAALRARLDNAKTEEVWAYEAKASAISLLDSIDVAQQTWQKVADGSRQETPPDRLAAVSASLILGDIATAREDWAAAEADGNALGRELAMAHALIDLAAGEERGSAYLHEQIASDRRPFQLRELGSQYLPLIEKAWAARSADGRLTSWIRSLREAAAESLAANLATPPPPLSYELDLDESDLAMAPVGPLVRDLLRIEEIRGSDPEAADKALQELAAAVATLEIGPTLAAAKVPVTFEAR